MTTVRWLIAMALAALLLAPAPAAAQQTNPVVRGNVTYAGQEAMPAGGVLSVQLQDVSRQDVAATVLAQQTIDVSGRRAPFAYELRYNPVQIVPTGRYVVRAEVRVGGVLAYTTTTTIPVLTGGTGTSATIPLQRTSSNLPVTGGDGPLAAAAIMALAAAALFMLRRRRGAA